MFKTGRLEEAIRHFERALEHAPAMAEAHFELARAVERVPDLDRAIRHYQQAMELAQDWGEPHICFGRMLEKVGRWAEAVKSYRRAAELSPGNEHILLNLGSLLRRSGNHIEAIKVLQRARDLSPEDPHSLNLLGIVLAETGDVEQAITCFRGSIERQDNLAEAWNNLGNATAALWRCTEAAEYFRKALQIRPNYPEAYDNLGKAYLTLGQWDEAAAALDQAISLRSDYAEAHVKRAQVRLLRGEYHSGWNQLEWYCRLEPSQPISTQRRWNTNISARGQSVLVRASDTAADVFPFVRFLPRLQRRGLRVCLEVAQPYRDLLSRTPGIDQMANVSSGLRCDHDIDLASLPCALGLDKIEQVPGEMPYLYPDPELVKQYAAKAQRFSGLRIGLSWKTEGPAWAAPPIAEQDLAPLARISGATIFCLDQTHSAQKTNLRQVLPTVDVAGWLGTSRCTWADWAAVLSNLDVVVTSDSAFAHLAGALGVPVYVALPITPGFCWLLEGDSTPWYPNAKLYRQTAVGDWSAVIRRIADDLSSAAARHVPNRRKAPDASDAKRLGTQWARQGLLAEGIASLRYATAIATDCAETWNNLGVALLEAGQLNDAQRALDRALQVAPDFAKAWNNLGNVCAELSDVDRAKECFNRAIALNPSYPEAHNNLGNALADQDRDAAIAQYRRALDLRPDYAEAMNNLANSLADQGNHAEAIPLYQRALEIKPRYAEAHNNLGTALQFVGRSADALNHLQMAIQLREAYPEAHNNLGSLLIEQDRFDEAIACFDRAIALRSDYAEAHMNRSLALLSLGDFARGWPEYEWRWRCKDSTRRRFAQPVWDGRPLEGKRVLLYAEQGLGDTMQFIRYAEQLKTQGATVIFECPKSLVRLISTCPWIDELIPKGEPLPSFDVQLPLLSVPAAVRTKLEDIPAQVPYLHPETHLVEQWRDRLEAYRGFRIGICWQGNPQFSSDRLRSIPLRFFEPLARCPNVELFSLQKHEGCEQLAEMKDSFSVIDLGPELDNGGDAFLDTAAVLQNLDLLISSDTAIVHLAGALHVPVWIALSAAADWRWLLRRADSPWYPSAKLFRQRQLGDWRDVFDRIAAELDKHVNDRATITVHVKIAPGELFDKISILEIKAERMRNEQKLQHVREELAELQTATRYHLADTPDLLDLRQQLKHVNERLWDIEDEIRKLERDQDFGERFVQVARSVYKNNDLRAALKKQINQILGAQFMEEKEYVE